MTGKMKWGRARKFKSREEGLEHGTVIERTGRMVYNEARDTLEAKARKAERQWLRQQKRKKPPKVKDRYKPTPYDISRNPSLAQRKPPTIKGRDVVMDVLAEMSGEPKPPKVKDPYKPTPYRDVVMDVLADLRRA